MLGKYRSKFLLVRSGLLMTLTEIGLRLAGFKRIEKNLARLARVLPFKKSARPDPGLTQQVGDIVDRASHTTSIYPVRCLPRSLVLKYFLQRYGQQPQLKLGVQTITGEFRAHAWIECNGTEINETVPANELYVPLDWTATSQTGRKT